MEEKMQQLSNGATKHKPPSAAYHQHQQQHQLLLASLGLNLGLLLFFFIDFRQSPSGAIQVPYCSSAPAIKSCALQNTHFSNSIRNSSSPSTIDTNTPINLDHGDPTMFEAYWLANGDACALVVLGWEHMSYFASRKHFIWFVEQELDNQIRSLHSIVGNAATQGRSIVVGTGSTQLFQAALYSISPRDDSSPPARVVSATPYYSSYPVLTDYLRSGIYKWAGDATSFKPDENSYIELVTSPNNPDGTIRTSVVNGGGPVIYDLAYYWPHYTPITSELDHDIMLFTVSKSTGHAGSRIGWAIVRDPEVAKTMTKFIELNTIGVSHDSQLRAAQILKSIVRGYTAPRPFRVEENFTSRSRFFHFGYREMNRRWEAMRKVVSTSGRFSLSDFAPAFCTFFGQPRTPHPAFAWLRCNREADCRRVLELGGILTRSGIQFGAGAEYVRISMLDREHNFETFLKRLGALAAAREEVQ